MEVVIGLRSCAWGGARCRKVPAAPRRTGTWAWTCGARVAKLESTKRIVAGGFPCAFGAPWAEDPVGGTSKDVRTDALATRPGYRY